MEQKRTLIYTCCDEKYSHFIPLFCASLLWSNKNIDIEIGTCVKNITQQESDAVERLRKMYPESKILIDFGLYENGYNGGPLINGFNVLPNTVRFITQPKLTADYVYISDVDIIMLQNNFYELHIKDMEDTKKSYSNIVRSDGLSMTGLHFAVYDKHYPINISGINLSASDEWILRDIVSKKTEVDYQTDFRPVHGVHMSLNRPTVEGDERIPGWGAKQWKDRWREFEASSTYAAVKDSFNDLIIGQINKLNAYYVKIK